MKKFMICAILTSTNNIKLSYKARNELGIYLIDEILANSIDEVNQYEAVKMVEKRLGSCNPTISIQSQEAYEKFDPEYEYEFS